jgi:16S rRNA (guanine(966)-N(2))-methyltransferase RsmD
LAAPRGVKVRPTSAKVREALFGILAAEVPGGGFIDLFAGTGAIGLEALSRGAAWVEFVERDAEALAVLRANLARTGFADRARVHALDALRYLKTRPADAPRAAVVFADPPYASPALKKLLPQLERSAIIAPTGAVVIEHFHKQPLPQAAGGLRLERDYRYGDTVLSLYRPPRAPAEPARIP